MKIRFLGGVEQVTGSKYCIQNGNTKVLVDCGLVQGAHESRSNRDKVPVDPSSIDAIILTHAHIDHTGYIPVLVKNGFKGSIYCSKATYKLSLILLVDSGYIHEMQAKEAQKNKDESHLSTPLYTVEDAKKALTLFKVVDYEKEVTINADLTFSLIASHHILGASFVRISDGKKVLTFSGDLGRPNTLIMKSPPPVKNTDYLVLESTYGDRLHDNKNPIEALSNFINQTINQGGIIVIPSFAVGRAQTILYVLYQLKQQNKIPDIPIFLDSPMAIKATNLFCEFEDEHKLSIDICNKAFQIATYTRTPIESKNINHINQPAIIIAGSGMAEGGRVIYHLKRLISDPKNMIIFAGYQGDETNGSRLVEGAKEVTIEDKVYEVRAKIEQLNMFSAHADYNEILQWLSHFEQPPIKTFLTHGEKQSAESLKKLIENKLGWHVIIPHYDQEFQLD